MKFFDVFTLTVDDYDEMSDKERKFALAKIKFIKKFFPTLYRYESLKELYFDLYVEEKQLLFKELMFDHFNDEINCKFPDNYRHSDPWWWTEHSETVFLCANDIIWLDEDFKKDYRRAVTKLKKDIKKGILL